LSDIKSPSNTFADFVLGRSTRLRVALAEDIFFASKNPIQKKNNNAEDAGKLFNAEQNERRQRAEKFCTSSIFCRADNTLFWSIGHVSMLKFK